MACKHSAGCTDLDNAFLPAGVTNHVMHGKHLERFKKTMADDKYLHALPRKDVYRLLIDTYRLRARDCYTIEGNAYGAR